MPYKQPDNVEATIASLPDKPGVYMWKSGTGEVLYVGKANRLRQRVKNYFTADHSYSPKNHMLVRLIADLDTIVVRSEAEALLLENNLIKEYKPRFNIRLRDDKSYPYVAVTLTEPFPRVLVVRRLDIPGARFFGPYTDVAVLRRTLRVIRRVFAVRSCHFKLPNDAPDRPCLDYHIHRCLAPCVGYQDQTDYRQMIHDVVAFLEGKTVEVRTRLRERMDEAAARLDYERAAEIRNSLLWLKQLEKPQGVQFVGGRNTDAIGFARDGDDAVCVILRVRDGKIIASQHRFLESLDEEPNEAVLSAFLVRYYVPTEERARKAVLSFAPEDLESVAALIPETKIHVPQRGVYQRLVELADQNARHLLESFRIESFETEERAEDPVYALGRDLGLTVLPRHFVCIDISTNQGTDTVGSLVWFEGGRPKKSEYRKFKIRGDDEAPKGQYGQEIEPRGHPDDYAAIREVVRRYLTRRINEQKQLPDLMVIDGGKGQLNAALEVLKELKLDLPLASLAKREEEVFLPGRSESIKLSRRAPSLKLLQRIRDEAHRFAITYNRQRRKDRTITSTLLNIPGVGDKRRRLLLERFGSLAGVTIATPEELAALPGFSTRLAERILEYLKQ